MSTEISRIGGISVILCQWSQMKNWSRIWDPHETERRRLIISYELNGPPTVSDTTMASTECCSSSNSMIRGTSAGWCRQAEKRMEGLDGRLEKLRVALIIKTILYIVNLLVSLHYQDNDRRQQQILQVHAARSKGAAGKSTKTTIR